MTNASPASARLIATVDALRTALAESPDVLSFTLGGTIDEETAAAAEADGVPREFLDFCRVLDGASCGPSVQLFGLEEAEEHQFYCEPVVDSPLPLSPGEALLRRDDPGGPGLPRPCGRRRPRSPGRRPRLGRRGALRASSRPGSTTFFLDRLAAPAEYTRLALIDDELLEYDDWLKLLRRAGLTG